MAWIESHEEPALGWNVRRLARKAGISHAEAVGRIHMLWHYSAKVHPLDRLDVLVATDWHGDEQVFVDALIICEYLIDCGGSYEVPGWWEMGGKRRHIDKERDRMTPALRAEVIHRDGSFCNECDAFVSDPHVDHVVALANGGKTEMDNLQILCREHNLRKGAR